MFCEECGAKLEPGIRFCENCGTPVPLSTVASDSKKEIASDMENGVIVTRLASLAAQLGSSSQELFNKIAEYVQYKKSRGINYTLIDLENSGASVGNVISALKNKRNETAFKYVFILGNEEIIEVAEFENLSRDSDSTVTTDLPFMTLMEESPWNNLPDNIEDFYRVGRLPSYRGESFSKFVSYFENSMKSDNSFEKLKPYGLSAKVWKPESDYEYNNISLKSTDSAPDITVSSVSSRIESDSNIFFFNLHGSGETKYWYGQKDDNYPEAFSPDNLSSINRPYFLGVEACYGARYLGNLDENESILIRAMQSGCLALLGSSKIAYGTSAPEGSCADFMIGEYLKQIVKGASAGDAHIAGIKRLFEDEDDFSDTEIKTLSEFSLYGDPSAHTGKNASKITLKSTFSSSLINGAKKTVNGFHISMPDIRRSVGMSLAEVDEKISTIINEHVYSTHKELAGIIPRTYKMSEKELWQSIYEKKNGVIQKTVKVYFEKNGKITRELESK